jgi:CBS domain-containing protein
MRKKALRVRDCMTHLPVEAERCETVVDASKLMAKQHIRHLPVMSGSRLTGIISEGDVLAAQLRWGAGADLKPLEEICQKEVLTVSPVTPIDEVTDRMLSRQVGSAVVVDGGYVVGMFTTTDALRLLRELFAES